MAEASVVMAHAFVTGGATGIGLACALHLVRDGATVDPKQVDLASTAARSTPRTASRR
jgi:NAD(P)-dependent dehydrogenase (short-subunit alcohol dehydrogenase family)